MREAHDRDGGGDGVGDGDVEEEEYCGGDVHDVGVGSLDVLMKMMAKMEGG